MSADDPLPQVHTLLDELYALDRKFKDRANQLNQREKELNGDRSKFERALAAKEWELQKQKHALDLKQEASCTLVIM